MLRGSAIAIGSSPNTTDRLAGKLGEYCSGELRISGRHWQAGDQSDPAYDREAGHLERHHAGAALQYIRNGSVTFGRVAIGLSSFAGATVAGTNRQVTFNGGASVTVAAGAEVFSDAVRVDWAGDGDDERVSFTVEGRNLAISMFIPGSSGPMTFHGTALQPWT